MDLLLSDPHPAQKLKNSRSFSMVAISSETATDVATAKASHLGNLVAAVIKMNSVLNGPGEGKAIFSGFRGSVGLL